MILADSSIWIDHFRTANILLSDLLERGMVLCHPCIVGELALGNLQERSAVIHFHDSYLEPWWPPTRKCL